MSNAETRSASPTLGTNFHLNPFATHVHSFFSYVFSIYAAMGLSRRLIIICSSVFVLLILAISLATSLEVRAPPDKLIQISLAQAAKIGQADRDLLRAKG